MSHVLPHRIARAGHMSKLSIQAWLGDARRKRELAVFLLLSLLLAPVLAITTVGSYGLGVWIYQMMAGPPGPPTKSLRSPGVVSR